VQDNVPGLRSEMTVGELVAQVTLIQEAMKVAMKDGEHFGVIPGTEKPTLLKPGAEKLCLLFRLDPEYESMERWEGEHYTVTAICRLFHIPTGNRVASGQGLCSTKETKYAYRNAKRVCPACGAEQIIKGQEKYGGGWVCWKKKGGCGAKYQDDDPAIESQEAGQKPNENLPDTYNTVLKMACKRALVAAVLNGTAASDIFTQDLDQSDESLSEAVGGLEARDTSQKAAASESDRPLSEPEGSSARSHDTSQPSGSESDQSVTKKAARERLSYALKDLAAVPVPADVTFDNWADFAQSAMNERYGITDSKKLSIEQLDDLTSYLRGFDDIPLTR
jgi:hypothetical protein